MMFTNKKRFTLRSTPYILINYTKEISQHHSNKFKVFLTITNYIYFIPCPVKNATHIPGPSLCHGCGILLIAVQDSKWGRCSPNEWVSNPSGSPLPSFPSAAWSWSSKVGKACGKTGFESIFLNEHLYLYLYTVHDPTRMLVLPVLRSSLHTQPKINGEPIWRFEGSPNVGWSEPGRVATARHWRLVLGTVVIT